MSCGEVKPLSRKVIVILMIIIAASLFQTLSANAAGCNDKPVGFGFASLEDLKESLNKSYDVKQHCERHKKSLSQIKDQISEVDQVEKSVKSARLVLLGEEHVNPSQRDYDAVFEQLKKMNPKMNCLFLEWDANDPEVKKLIKGEKPDSYKYLQHYELVSKARAHKTKIFAVDGRDQTKEFDPKDLTNYVRESNLAIFKNVKQIIDSETCESGILLVGKAHIEHPQLQIDPKDSLKTFFVNNGIETVAINFVYTGKNEYQDNFDQQWQWKICDEKVIEPLGKQHFVSRQQLNSIDALVLFPIKTFDFYLFMPQIEANRLYPQ